MVLAFGQISVLSAIFSGNPSLIPDQVRTMLFRIVPGETQKAPSRIAPTKTNAAHTANILSFIVTSTRRTSITVVPTKSLAENGAFQKRVDCCSAAEFVHDTLLSGVRPTS
jgi:hypothetical protein